MPEWLCKANDEGPSHRGCIAPLAALPGQADCPWCGCAYMIPCAACQKAFTFAWVVEIDQSYEDLLRTDILYRGLAEVDETEVRAVAAWLAGTLADFEAGDMVAYLDGCYIRTDQRLSPSSGCKPHDH